MKLLKRTVTLWLLLAMFAAMTCGCSGNSKESEIISNPSKPQETVDDSQPQELTPEEIQKKENFANSTPENDTDVGLKNIKIDMAEWTLTDEQKAVLEYFDDDYLTVPSYEFLRRYPNVFQDAQLTVWGMVKKVISMDSDTYKILLWLNIGPYEETWNDLDGHESDFVLLEGKTGSTWYMEKDVLQVYGRYTGVETVEVDGTSYTVPVVNVQTAYYDQSVDVRYRSVPKFDYVSTKKVAEAIFGKDIEIRDPIVGTDISEETEMLILNIADTLGFYTVELENQSNANFTKFFFYTEANVTNRIVDAKDIWDVSAPTGIERVVEFSADFEHYFLFTYNTNLETLELAYYDRDFHKIWEREFEETTNAHYDYTKNNIYLTTNNELYIINIETGEDTFAPTYVGAKAAIRKLDDGILMISESKSDGAMKCSLDGSIIWKTNLAENVFEVSGLQIVGDNIVFYYQAEDYTDHYVVLDKASGSVIQDAVPI